MDQLVPIHPSPKRRRRFTREFKQQVLEACEVPGNSIASVARQFELNANLVHKWRRERRVHSPTGFVRLPAPVDAIVSNDSGSRTTVRIELPGGVVAHWPTSEINQSVHWLKAMISR